MRPAAEITVTADALAWAERHRGDPTPRIMPGWAKVTTYFTGGAPAFAAFRAVDAAMRALDEAIEQLAITLAVDGIDRARALADALGTVLTDLAPAPPPSGRVPDVEATAARMARERVPAEVPGGGDRYRFSSWAQAEPFALRAAVPGATPETMARADPKKRQAQAFRKALARRGGRRPR